MALREHYADRIRSATALAKVREISSSEQPDSTKVQEIKDVTDRGTAREDDAWALPYISIARIQPLLEAFDDDASSLVSISEVNEIGRAHV